MLNVDLRGDKRKREFLDSHEVAFVFAVKLTGVKNVIGSCGPVTDEFYVFRARGRKLPVSDHQFLVMGPGCAKAMTKLLDVAHSKPWNPAVAFRKGSDIPEIYHRLCPRNRQLHDAIWLLCLAWRVLPQHQLLEILNAIYTRPADPVPDHWLEKFANTLSKDRQGRDIIALMADLRKQWRDLRWFDFDELLGILRQESPAGHHRTA